MAGVVFFVCVCVSVCVYDIHCPRRRAIAPEGGEVLDEFPSKCCLRSSSLCLEGHDARGGLDGKDDVCATDASSVSRILNSALAFDQCPAAVPVPTDIHDCA
eukprot:14833641-Alexandrium_andersonii.AAC.1